MTNKTKRYAIPFGVAIFLATVREFFSDITKGLQNPWNFFTIQTLRGPLKNRWKYIKP